MTCDDVIRATRGANGKVTAAKYKTNKYPEGRKSTEQNLASKCLSNATNSRRESGVIMSVEILQQAKSNYKTNLPAAELTTTNFTQFFLPLALL